MRIDVIRPADLGPSERATWRRLQAESPWCGSPYYAVDFAQMVGAARSDARIAVIEDGGKIVSFLGVQRPSPLAAMAIGMPISDYHGLVGDPGPDLTGAMLCQALKVGRIDFGAMPDAAPGFAEARKGSLSSFVAQLGPGGSAAYLAELRKERADTIRKMNRKRANMAAEGGEIVFTANSRNRAHFDELMRWSTCRCDASHQPPVWKTRWVRQTLEQIWESTDSHFSGVLFTDEVGGNLAAAQFLLRAGPVMHVWIIGHSQQFERYSPGTGLMRLVIEWAADNGYSEVDLGYGDYQFKRQLTNSMRPLSHGFIGRPSASAAVRSFAYRVRASLEKSRNQFVREFAGRAMRRIDAHRGLGLLPPRMPQNSTS